MIDVKTDGHVHTKFCHHAVGEMEDYVVEAVGQGLDGIIFLEHLELGINYPYPTWLTAEDFGEYLRQGMLLKQKYQDDIFVGLGVEVGFNPRQVERIIEFLAKYQWDRVGVSYHFMEIDGEHYNLVSRKPRNLAALGRLGIGRVVTDYLRGLTEAVKVLPGTVVCHLDAVLRYHPDISFSAEHMAMIDQLLAAMAAKGMALEVNCSGFKIRGTPFPGPQIIEMALARGIKLQAGSDAHRPQDVGRYFARLNKYYC